MKLTPLFQQDRPSALQVRLYGIARMVQGSECPLDLRVPSQRDKLEGAASHVVLRHVMVALQTAQKQQVDPFCLGIEVGV